MLTLNGINAGYGHLNILRDVSLEIARGEFVALIGPNGAGKTTTLRVISGLLAPSAGEVLFEGAPVQQLSVRKKVQLGISFVTDDGALFPNMTVRENLLMGAYTLADRERKSALYAETLELFPHLKDRLKQTAGTLSGGERKMLAIARGLMSAPRLMLVDEPSLGLSPLMASQVFETLKRLTQKGVTVLMVEQNVNMTLQLVQRAYLLQQGQIVGSGTGSELLNDPHVQQVYLGI